MLLALATLYVPVPDLPQQSSAQTQGGGSPPPVIPPSDENRPPAATAPAAGTRSLLEDRRGWSADKKAEEATKRATDLKAQAHRRKDEPCPVAADWDKWFQETLDL
jgi:hypothetical protein